ncbi:helix-turn-helix domain-containing protein [Embleya sp. NPDC008237]|uniref:helix-turn-helix domain-containing protein n=1 Tax=Embleya sp. NPDC008237 TaxID=3363978 RepID=UPI0036F03147
MRGRRRDLGLTVRQLARRTHLSVDWHEHLEEGSAPVSFGCAMRGHGAELSGGAGVVIPSPPGVRRA